MATTDIVIEYIVPPGWHVFEYGKQITNKVEDNGYVSGIRILHLDIEHPDDAYHWLINQLLIVPPRIPYTHKKPYPDQRDYRAVINDLKDSIAQHIEYCVDEKEWVLPVTIEVGVPIGASLDDPHVEKLTVHMQNQDKTIYRNRSV